MFPQSNLWFETATLRPMSPLPQGLCLGSSQYGMAPLFSAGHRALISEDTFPDEPMYSRTAPSWYPIFPSVALVPPLV